MATIFKAVSKEAEFEGALHEAFDFCRQAGEGIITASLDAEHLALCPSSSDGYFAGFSFNYEWDGMESLMNATLTYQGYSLPLEEWLYASEIAAVCSSCGKQETYTCKSGIEVVELLEYLINRYKSKRNIQDISPEMPAWIRETYISGNSLCPICWHNYFRG